MPPIDRRSFLKRGLFGGLLLTVAGGVGLDLWPTRAVQPRRALRVFDRREFSVLVALARRLVGAPEVDPVETAHRVDATLYNAPVEVQHDLKRLLRLFDNGLAGLLLDGHARPFTRLPTEDQDAVLRAWRDSRLALRRGGFQALRKLTNAAWYASPSTWASVGYPGPPQIGGKPG